MRIGKPLLITCTVIGLGVGIFEAFHLAGALGFLVVALVGAFGAGMAWLVGIERAEARAARGAPPGSPPE